MNLNKVTVDDINVKGKRVLVRVDFNVPLKDGVITNDNRITAALPTIKKLIADGGKVILCSHLGKPKNGPEAKFSLAPVAVRLSELLGKEVIFADDDEVVGENAKKAVAEMKDGDVVLLQNTRFRKESRAILNRACITCRGVRNGRFRFCSPCSLLNSRRYRPHQGYSSRLSYAEGN